MARGGLVTTAAMGAGMVVLGIVGVVFAVRAMSSGPAPPPIRGPAGNASVGEQGMGAQGTTELRQLGCAPALVVDMRRLIRDTGQAMPGEPRYMVTCDVPAGADAPSCERAAGVYFGAIGGMADDPVAVRVLRGGALAPVCSRLYAPNGADLGPFR